MESVGAQRKMFQNSRALIAVSTHHMLGPGFPRAQPLFSSTFWWGKHTRTKDTDE